MSTPTPLEIVCGVSLGPFVLGSRLHEVFAIIRRECYRDVTISWDDQVRQLASMAIPDRTQHASSSPLIIALRSPPLRLAFAGETQRLAFIELLDPGQWASYKSSTLRVDDGAATLRGIAKLFGPTIAPVAHPAHSEERLTTYAAGVAFSSAGMALKRVVVCPSSSSALSAAVFSSALAAPRALQDGSVNCVEVAVRLLGSSPSRASMSPAARRGRWLERD